MSGEQLQQNQAPIMRALNEFKQRRIVPFDVPGHKRGKGSPELVSLLGDKCLALDVNSMKPLDNLCHPVSIIRQAEELAAAAFGAAHAFFMVGGTTSAVQAMIMSVCGQGDKIILPRNVHRSVINALILSGARPVYVDPGVSPGLGVPLGVAWQDMEQAVLRNPDAKAVLVNNPTYYGICSNLEAISGLAHSRGMKVLADEAHGTHFYFGENMPLSAMAAGADMAAISMHKSGGSLTQSSILLLGEQVNHNYARQVINLTQTTSASYLLLASLDVARRKLALEGRAIFQRVMEMAAYAREEINQIGGYYAYGQDIVNHDSIFAFDPTKLSVNTHNTGLTGIEVYDILRDEYDIQIEFGDAGNFLAYISVGDTYKDIERLVSALSEIYRLYRKPPAMAIRYEYIRPQVVMGPREAFYAPGRQLPLQQAVGRVCGEFVMSYPPGIPVLAPGELVTEEIIEYIDYMKERGCVLTGAQDLDVRRIMVIDQ